MTTKPIENKVEYGLRNVHYAIATDDGTALTYGEWKSIPGAVELSIDPEGSSEPFYADDTDYYDAVSNQGFTGKVSFARLTDEFMQEVFGERKDETTGEQYDDTDAQPKAIILGYEFDGDQKRTRRLLRNVKATRPSEGSKTKEDKIEVNTQELDITAAPDPYLHSSKGKFMVGDAGYDSLFDKPYVAPAGAVTAPTSVKLTADPTATVKTGETVKINAAATPAGTAVTYKSADEATATVAADGTVTGVKAGNVDVTITAGNQTATCKVTVTAA